jgi:hypothetical protein
MLAGQQTSPNVLEGIVAYGVARKLGQTSTATKFLGCLYTTADYFLGCNAANTTWVTGLGTRHPNQVFKIDCFSLGYHDGIVPYGPWVTDNTNYVGMWVTDHNYADQTDYPPVGTTTAPNWPGNERWNNNRWSPMSSEFTISQNLAPSAALFGFLCAQGPAAPVAPPPLSLSISGTSTNAARISWPSAASGGFVLQQTTNLLANSNWVPVAQFPADDGTNKNVIVYPTTRVQGFRLKWP